MPNDDVCLDKNFIESLFFLSQAIIKKNVNVWYTSRVFLHTNYSIPKKRSWETLGVNLPFKAKTKILSPI